MKEVFGIIYKTTCLINGKIYIGQNTTGNKNYMGSGTLIRAAIKKYGKENFIRETLIECYNQVELDEWEDLLIWEYNSRDKSIGYNIAKGSVLGAIGEMSPTKLPEVRRKIKESWDIPEVRLKRIESIKGRKCSEETKAKISEAKKGKTLSEEHRKNMSEAKKGKIPYNKGKNMTIKQKIKLSKPVLQYDRKGNIIAEYSGATEASKHIGISRTNITICCKGRQKSSGGYIWKYK